MPKAYWSSILRHDRADVWPVVRDFNSLPTWSYVTQSQIEDGKAGDQVGAVRVLGTGVNTVRQRLLALSDLDHSYSYTYVDPIPGSPLGNFVATLRLTAIYNAQWTFAEYEAVFDVQGDYESDWRFNIVDSDLRPKLDGLGEYLDAHFPRRPGPFPPESQ